MQEYHVWTLGFLIWELGVIIGYQFRRFETKVKNKPGYEHKIIHTIDMNLIKPGEDIDDFIYRASVERLGTYIME